MDPDETAALATLLEANGFSSEDAGSNVCSTISTLEMFLQDYPKIAALQHFPNLKELRLMDQRIQKIEGLGGCPQLQKLWLIENRVAQITGLHTCAALQELYLTSNKITSIQGLEQLSGLQVLWLADNYISSITGLSSLLQLRQLNLARNDISRIHNSLLANSLLTSLNLADNKLSSFQDVVSSLKGMTQLQELCFADPFWGSCPLTGLCNYQTFMLAQLPQLRSLDTLLLADDSKSAAAVTFAKKQLYYNMRIRTIKRAAADLRHKARAAQQAEASKWNTLYARMAYAAKRISSQQQLGSQTAESARQQLQALQAAMQALQNHQQGLTKRLAADVEQSLEGQQAAIARLELELGSAGNVWLEEARPGDAWLLSCQELLQHRLTAAAGNAGNDQAPCIQVLSATKIHNRHLRMQLAKHKNSCSNPSSEQYLIYAGQPGSEGELLELAQHGLRPCSSCPNSDLGPTVRLSTHVDLALQTAPATSQTQSGSTIDGSSKEANSAATTVRGQLWVCKAFVGGLTRMISGCACPSGSTGDGHVQLGSVAGDNISPDTVAVYRSDGPQPNVSSPSCSRGSSMRSSTTRSSITRSSSGGGDSGSDTTSGSACGQKTQLQPRIWYFFDPTAVLPEYIVNFQYSPGKASSAPASAGGNKTEASPALLADPLLQLCAQPLTAWLQHTKPPKQVDPRIRDATEHSLEQLCEKVLAAVGPVSCLRLPELTRTGLAAFVGNKQLDSLTYLSLQDCGICSADGLCSYLPQLAVLILSFNKLTALSGLNPAKGSPLSCLDVSHNLISSWKGSWLAGCSSLKTLDASFNLLAEPQDLEQLSKSLSGLQHLNLCFNPVQQHKAYLVGLSSLVRLTQLDGQPVEAVELAGTTSVSPALMCSGASLWHTDAGPVQMLPSNGSNGWQQLLHSLVLEGQQLRSLQGIAAAVNLISLNCADNLLRDLAGLAGCTRLQYLNLSNNLLMQELTGLTSLVCLHQLDLSYNKVHNLMPMSSLTTLSHLSIEGNTCSTLVGLTSLTNLVELYAANNNLRGVKEAERLATLPRLVVLDLVGNPLVSNTDGYRLLLLYRLTHLKVLDGSPAEAAELAAAHAQHAGRLTLSLLEQHLGSTCITPALQQLDISGLGIIGLGTIFAAGGPLTALTGLILDNNQLTSLAPLAGLSRLALLSINSNNLGDGEPGSVSFAVACASAVSGTSSEAVSLIQPLLPRLQTLHLASNGLTSLVPLQLGSLSGLRSLFIQCNDLSRLDGLEGLVQLKELVADKNKIRVFEPEALSALVHLRELRLEDNLMKSIALPSAAGAGNCCSALGACFPNLCVLHLGNNRLIDGLECAEKLGCLPRLMEVSLAGNPLSRKQVYRSLLISRCAQLQAIDGQPVTQQEHEYLEAMANLSGPSHSIDVPQYNAATLLAAAVDTRATPLPAVNALAPSGPLSSRSAQPAAPGPRPVAVQVLPTVLNHDALASMAVARQALFGSGTAGLTMSAMLPSSVPSIQSGVLVLSGAASFGLAGTAIGSSCNSGGGSNAGAPQAGGLTRQRPASGGSARPGAVIYKQQQDVGVAAATSPRSRRTTTGSLMSYRPGFTVRQATFHY